jgi:hypothetical protein
MTEPATPGAPTEFDYMLNRLELASKAETPADHGYKMHRDALFAYVRDLERRAPQPDRALLVQAAEALTLLTDAFCSDDYGTREGRDRGRKALICARAAIAALSATQEKPHGE